VTGVGIIGLGMAVKPHALALRDLEADGRVRVLGGFAPSGDRRAAFAAAWGWPVFDRAEALLAAPGLDLVILLTPPRTHLPLAEQAFAAGHDVLVEKPVEWDAARAAALVEAASRAGRTAAVVFQHRFRPAALRLKAALEDGALGRVLSASATIRWWRDDAYFATPGRGMRARDGGGVLLTQAIHSLDLLLHLAGPVESVMGVARTSGLRAIDTEDIAAAALRFAHGAIGAVDATTVARPGFPERIEIAGTRGSAVLAAERLELHIAGAPPEVIDHGSAGGGGADPMAFDHGPHRAMITEVLDAIAQRRAASNAAATGLAVQRLIEAWLRSSESGRAEAP
jgi:predicted dehydrogenase